jgi:hypothetical protein
MKAALNALLGKVEKGAYVDVGFLKDAEYPGSVHRPDTAGVKVAQVAFQQEFGGPVSDPVLGNFVIPPRPFFRTMIAENKGDWPKELRAALKASQGDTMGALGIMGEKLKEQLQDSIQHGAWLPDSAITLMLRKMCDDDPSLVVTPHVVAEAKRRVARGETGATGDRARPLLDTKVMLEAVNYEVVDNVSAQVSISEEGK